MALSRYLLFLLLAFTGPGAWAQDEERNIDPWEPINRRIFVFNETVDKYLLNPIARGYQFVTPDPMERGVNNFISNIYQFTAIINSALQGRGEDTVHISGRFLVNSTLGLLGIFDVASRMGLEYRPADYGQTLAVWGFEEGPFLMVPIIGPRTVRSGVGNVMEAFSSIPYLINDSELTWGFFALEAIDVRAQLLKGEGLITGDRYIFQRNAYLQHRAYYVSGGNVEDRFSDYEDEENFEEF